MIGYVKVYKPELKLKELTVYNAYYCGICEALGKRYGLLYRNVLNYDAVFLAMSADCLNGAGRETETFRCALHPFKKKPRCMPSESMDKAADITVFLTYHKLLDNKNDENSFWSGIGAYLMKSSFLKAGDRLGDTSSKVESALKRLHGMEKAGSRDIDSVSDCYASIISNLLAKMVKTGDNDVEAAKWIGYNIGKWVYILDAVDDIEEDLSSGAYNPVLKRFPIERDEQVKDYIKRTGEKLSFILFSCLDQASTAFDLIDKKVNSGIIRNILYEGMYNVTHKILNGEHPDGSKEPL